MSDKWFAFAERYGLQCVSLKRAGDCRLLSRSVNSQTTVPFCLQLKKLEGIVLPKSTSGEAVQLKVNTSLYHSKSKQFFGRTWSSHPTSRKSTINRKDSININQNVYFHTAITDTNAMILIEIVAICNGGELSCGWTYLAPFGNVKLLKDTMTKSSSQPARLDVYQGSPRMLFFVEDVTGENGLTAVPGCHVHYLLMTHSAMQPAFHLFPENLFVGAQDDIPGLFNRAEDSIASGPLDVLWKPKLAKRSSSIIEKLSLELYPSLDHFERLLLNLLNRDRKAKDNLNDDVQLNIAERRLLVGIHNGWSFIKRPHIAYLDMNSGEKSGKVLKRRTSLRLANQEDETVMKCLSLPTVIQLTDVVAHPLYTLVFMLEYVISWPLTQNDKVNAGVQSMTKSQSQSVLACWAAWTPTDATETHHLVELPLCGGAGTNPGQTLVFVGSDGKENQLGDGDCGTVYFKYTSQEQKRKSMTETTSGAQFQVENRARHPSGVVSDIGSELHTRRQSETDTFHEASESVVTQLEAGARPQMLRPHMTPRLGGNVEHDGPVHRPSLPFVTPVPVTMQELTRRPATSTPADELYGQQGELSTLMYTPIVGVAAQSTVPSSLYQHQVPFQRFTSTHAPITLPESVHFTHYSASIPRSAYAQLHAAGFPEVKDSEGRAPVNIDPQQTVTCNPERELKQPLQCNNITIQFLAISNVPFIQQSLSHATGGAFQSTPLYKMVFFTFQFYRFQPITTERLLLSGLSSNTQLGQPSIHILSKLSGIDSVSGYQVEFPVDPAEFEPDESRQLVHYLYSRTLQIDVWDGESLLQIGTALLPLKHLIREGREAVQVTHEVPVTYVEYSNDSPTLIGDVIRSGSVRPAGVVSEIRGQLHVRLFNVGSRSSLDRAGPVSTSVMGNAGIIPSDSNAMSLADGRLPSTGAEPRRVKAKLLVESDKDLAAVLQSRRVGLPRPDHQLTVLNGDNLETKQRKLSRMAKVRQLSGLNHVSSLSSTASLTKQRAQELRTISAFRERHKQERLLSALCYSITTAHTIRPSYGVANFFEFILKNPYNSPLTVRIEWNCEDLLLVTDTREWQHYKRVSNTATPLEEDMFSDTDTTDNSNPQLFLKPNETVYIPFKYQSFHLRSQPRNKTVSFVKTDDSRPVSILNLHVEPQPQCIDQTFHFQHPEQAFFKKAIILPSFQSVTEPISSDENHSLFSLHCSDSNVVCEIRDGEGREPNQVYLKVACEAAPSVVHFYLLLYIDPYRSRPVQRWQFSVYSVQRIDFSAVQGQTSHLTVILRGLSIPRTVRCFSSHPGQLLVNPSMPFQLSANAAHEIHMALKSMQTGIEYIFVNVVDVEFHQLVRSWLVCATCRPPVITKAFEQVLSVGTGKHASKKISYHNPYSGSKRFHLSSTSPEMLQFREDVIEIPACQTCPIGLKFFPQMTPVSVEVLIFINNDNDKTEECFCVKLVYRR